MTTSRKLEQHEAASASDNPLVHPLILQKDLAADGFLLSTETRDAIFAFCEKNAWFNELKLEGLKLTAKFNKNRGNKALSLPLREEISLTDCPKDFDFSIIIACHNKSIFAIYNPLKKNNEILDRSKGFLGKGGCGKVKLAQDLSTGQWVALKRVHAKELMEQKALARLGRLKTSLSDYFIMDLYSGVSVLQYLSDLKNKNLPKNEKRLIYADIVAATLLAAVTLYQDGVISWDLSPRNIMLNESNNDLTIIDFDRSQLVETPASQECNLALAISIQNCFQSYRQIYQYLGLKDEQNALHGYIWDIDFKPRDNGKPDSTFQFDYIKIAADIRNQITTEQKNCLKAAAVVKHPDKTIAIAHNSQSGVQHQGLFAVAPILEEVRCNKSFRL